MLHQMVVHEGNNLAAGGTGFGGTIAEPCEGFRTNASSGEVLVALVAAAHEEILCIAVAVYAEDGEARQWRDRVGEG